MESVNHEPSGEILYDYFVLVDKEIGDYGSRECLHRGQLGTYRLKVGNSITDVGKVVYIYQNDRFFLNLYRTRARNVWVGKEEDEGKFYLFQFDGKEVTIFKRDGRLFSCSSSFSRLAWSTRSPPYSSRHL